MNKALEETLSNLGLTDNLTNLNNLLYKFYAYYFMKWLTMFKCDILI